MTGGGRILSLVLSLVTTRCVSKAQQSIFAKPAYFPRTITSVLSVTSVVKASHPPEFLANPATNDCEPTRHNPPRQQGHPQSSPTTENTEFTENCTNSSDIHHTRNTTSVLSVASVANPRLNVAGFVRIRISPRQPSEFWRIQLQRFCDAAIG